MENGCAVDNIADPAVAETFVDSDVDIDMVADKDTVDADTDDHVGAVVDFVDMDFADIAAVDYDNDVVAAVVAVLLATYCENIQLSIQPLSVMLQQHERKIEAAESLPPVSAKNYLYHRASHRKQRM